MPPACASLMKSIFPAYAGVNLRQESGRRKT